MLESLFCFFEKFVLLQVLDEHWRDHLNELIMLRSGIGLRSYAQRDPLVEYKAESFHMFQEMMSNIEKESVRLLLRAELVQRPAPPVAPPPQELQAKHDEMGYLGGQAAASGGGCQWPARDGTRRRRQPPRPAPRRAGAGAALTADAPGPPAPAPRGGTPGRGARAWETSSNAGRRRRAGHSRRSRPPR